MVAAEVFKILRSFNYEVVMYNDDLEQVYEPEEGRRMFISPANMLLSLTEDEGQNSIRLYIPKSLSVKEITGLIDTLRTTATKYVMLFNIRKFNKDLKPKDFVTKASVRESSEKKMNILEGFYGTSRSSYLKLENAKMIVRHSKRVDETIIGSRSRNIDQIFIENAVGERFLFPTTQLPPARAMAQHINQGGQFNDTIGNNIRNLATNYSNLAQTSRYIFSNGGMLSESAGALREACRAKMRKLRKTFEQLYRPSGYEMAVSNLAETSSVLVEGENTNQYIEEMKNLLIVAGKDISESMISGLVSIISESIKLDEMTGTVKIMGEPIAKDIWYSFERHKIDWITDPKSKVGETSFPPGKEGMIQKLEIIIPCVKDEHLRNLLVKCEDGMKNPEDHEEALSAWASAYGAIISAGLDDRRTMNEVKMSNMVMVLGRQVSKDAWEKFKSGTMEMTGTPHIDGDISFNGNDIGEISFRLSEIIPMVKDDSLVNLLSEVAEELPHPVKNHNEKSLLMIAKHAIKIARDTKVDEAKAAPMISVLGRNVDQNAWEDFKTGHLELMDEPRLDGEPKYTNKTAELLHKLSAIIPQVKNDSMLNLLSYVGEEIEHTKTPDKLKNMKMVAIQALKCCGMSLDNGMTKTSPIKAFEDWVHGSEMIVDDAWDDELDDEDLEAASDVYDSIAKNGRKGHAAKNDAIAKDSFGGEWAREKTRKLVDEAIDFADGYKESSDDFKKVLWWLWEHRHELSKSNMYAVDFPEITKTNLSPEEVDVIQNAWWDLFEVDSFEDWTEEMDFLNVIEPIEEEDFTNDSDNVDFISDLNDTTDIEPEFDDEIADEDMLLPQDDNLQLKHEVIDQVAQDPVTGMTVPADRNYISRLKTLGGLR